MTTELEQFHKAKNKYDFFEMIKAFIDLIFWRKT